MITGVTFSTFDLLHAGHISMLREAKSKCDYLICGLHINPQIERPNKNKPVQNIVERYIQLSAVKYVDEIVPYNTEEELLDILLCYPIDIRIIGADYIGSNFTGKELCMDNGIDIYYNNRKHSFSSSSLRSRIHESEKKS
jgi:glycerol-3-phosphate cytidylyltransferase